MSEARKRILQMLAEGKITVEQSEDLLQALETDQKAVRPPEAGPETADGKPKFSQNMEHMAKQFQSQFKDAVKNIEPHTREIKSRLKELGSWIQGSMNDMMKDFAFGAHGPIDGLECEFAVPEPRDFRNCRVVDVKNPYGAVTIKEGERFHLKVHGKISKAALAGEPPLDWFERNLLNCREDALIIGFERAPGFKTLLNLELTIPASLRLKLNTVAAPLKVNGGFTVESIVSISGDVALVGVNLENALIETVNGDVAIDDGSANLKASLTSGRLSLRNVSIRQLSAQSVSGDVSIERPIVEDSTTIAVNTTSGDIRIKRPTGQVAKVDLSSRTGMCTCDWGTAPTEPAHQGILELNSFGASLKLESISGDIVLD
jgi:DUF4097 and DUF4098 domain-containing protein YvlB